MRQRLQRRRAEDGHADRGVGRGAAPRLELLARPADDQPRVHPRREHRREERRAGDAAVRQGGLQLDELRRRRLPGLRREDLDPPVHRGRRGADAAPRQALRRQARQADHRPRAAPADEAGAGRGPVGHRRRAARGRGQRAERPDAGQARRHAGREQAVAAAGSGLGQARRAADRAPEGPALALRRGPDRPRPVDHGHRQLDRLHLGLGLELPVPPVPVPVDLAPVPGLAVGRDGPVRGPHGQDGRELQGRAHGRDGARRPVRRGA